MLRQDHQDRLSHLTEGETRALLYAHGAAHGTLQETIQARSLDHARLLRPIFRTTDPVCLHALETMIGKPITRIVRITKHAPTPRLSKPRPKRDDPRIITMILANPKKPGSASYDRYNLYRSGMTVTQALAAGITSGDLKWDESRGFITIGDA